MVFPLLIFAAQVAGAAKAPSAPPGSGAELVVQCITLVGMALGPETASGEQVQKASLRAGYVEGFGDGVKGGAICLPERPVMGVVQVYLDFMTKNPRYAEMPKAMGLRAALEAGFGCKK